MENQTVNQTIDVDEWWRGLSVDQKEHIATKVYNGLSYDERADLRARLNLELRFENGKDIVVYPATTTIWLDPITMPFHRKLAIRNHCEADHDFKRGIWSEGSSFSY